MNVTFEEVKNNKDIKTYITKADESLLALGYTEHSFPHVHKVSELAGRILEHLGYDEHQIELARIAGYLHDIGNIVNRVDHAQSGAVMAFRLLDRMNMNPEDIATVVTAIGNHDESTAFPVNPVAAALIIADKTDVRRSRVRNRSQSQFDIHDRVNYAVVDASLTVARERKRITLCLRIDTGICAVMDYFEIFLTRMTLCRSAAAHLGLDFELIINETRML